MGNMVLVVVGMFVLVWIISAVMKASQSVNPKPPPRPLPPPNRNRPNEQRQQQPEKTTNSDLERFMAEIDKLRTRGEAPPPPRPGANPQPPRSGQPATARAQTPARVRAERRPAGNRRTASPPPLPPKTEEVPVLRPVTPVEPAVPTGGGTAHTLPGFKQAKLARMASSGGGTLRDEVSPVLKTLQTILKTDQGPAIAMILTEIFGEPRCRRKF